MANLTEILKQAAIQAVVASDPAGILFGTVESVKPLSIRIDQKSPLPKEFFLLTSGVKKHTVSIRAESDDSQAGTRNYIVDNDLAAGDRVLLLRQQGGQLFIVLDKLEVGA